MINKELFKLFAPYYQISRNKFFPNKTVPPRTIAILLFALTICGLLYLGTLKTVHYFHAQNELGVILSMKIFQMSWITLFAMLIFSAMVSSVSTLYLAQDNEIIVSAPLEPTELFFLRFTTTTITTSWMAVFFSIPVFIAFGQVFQAGLIYWPLLLFTTISVALTGSSLALLLIICIVFLFPAKRTKDIVLYLSLCFGLFLYILFRMMRPEDLVNPDQYGQFIEYFRAVSTPAGPWLPASWAADSLSLYLLDRKVDYLLLGLLTTTPLVLYFAGEMAMNKFFLRGFSKSQESFGGHKKFRAPRGHKTRFGWIWRKELRQFTRDSGEWSQFFMIGALIIVYLYNFKVLPLDRSPIPTVYISNLIGFANIGLTGFIGASLATRFVYPSISVERGAFYLIGSSPLSFTRFLWYKYLFYFPPFTLLTLLLIVASNHLLQISGPMWWISLFAGLLMTWTVLGLGLGFGALFADFKSESKAGAIGPGSILFLFSAVFYQLVVLGSGLFPAYHIVRVGMQTNGYLSREYLLIFSWAGGMSVLSFLIVFIVWRAGIKRLASHQ